MKSKEQILSKSWIFRIKAQDFGDYSDFEISKLFYLLSQDTIVPTEPFINS